MESAPAWFWNAIATGVISVLFVTLGIIAFFLIRFFKSNDESWSEVKKGLNELISVAKIHDYRITANEEAIKDMRGHIVKYR